MVDLLKLALGSVFCGSIFLILPAEALPIPPGVVPGFRRPGQAMPE